MRAICGRITCNRWTNSALQKAIISPHDLRTLVGEHENLAAIRGTLIETPSHRIYDAASVREGEHDSSDAEGDGVGIERRRRGNSESDRRTGDVLSEQRLWTAAG